jgi:hypothetical protein
MWIKGKGIVNFPSDASGERPVAYTLLIIKNVNKHRVDNREKMNSTLDGKCSICFV